MTQDTDLLANLGTTPDPVSELVGEGKKYKTAADLARGKLEADAFIEQLKAENAELRKAPTPEVNEATVKALMERIEKATNGQNGNQSGTLSKEEIERLVKDGITTAQSEAGRRSNYVKSNAELLNAFKGDEATAASHLKTRAETLGLSKDEVTNLASSNPKMFRELFVPTTRSAPNTVTLPPGSAAPPDTSGGKRGKSYYTNLRKELGRKFFDVPIQQQMFRDRKALGEEFNAI